MRCQHVDDDSQCRMDATRRVLVGCGDPPDPDQAGFAGTIYMVQVCKQHDPTPASRCPYRGLLVPFQSANVAAELKERRATRATAWLQPLTPDAASLP